MTLRLEPADQPKTAPLYAGHGSLREGKPADVKAASPASTVYTVAQTVTVQYRGNTLHFRNGVGYSLHSDLKNFLTANGVTVTAV